ncbi:MAG: 16S rRNA (guanine(527)-N(7))-methyltransferase RsmG [Cyclobacteriaceae bacterium]
MDSNLVTNYFPYLSTAQQNQIEQLSELYHKWNEKINVISRKDIDLLYERHVLHSLAIAKFIQFSPGTNILDVGTGGGFPGIPLAILFPESRFHLVDSIGKKIRVVQEVAASIRLANVKASHIRAEQVKGKYDFVVSRAVTRLKPFIQWIDGCIAPGKNSGIIALKGGNLDEELAEIKRPYQMVDISDYFNEPFFETKRIVYVPF